jgi:type II secretory pathway predicted ATPase ExeA
MMIKLASAHYWRQLGLMTDPFPAATPLALFHTERWQHYLDFLLNTEQYRKALLLVIGESGVGKTTLLNQAYQSLQNKTKVLKIEADPKLDPESLLSFLAHALNALPSQNQANIEDAAETLLDRLQTTQLNYVLIIDKADLLPTATQGLCLHLVKYQVITRPCLQIILTGNLKLQEQFEKISHTQQNALHAYLIQILAIQPFSQEEVERYLKNQLKLAGDTGQLTFFSPLEIEKIYRASRGRPVGVQAAARTLLQNLVKPRKNSIKFKSPSKTKYRFLALILVFSLLGLGLSRLPSHWTHFSHWFHSDQKEIASQPVQPVLNPSPIENTLYAPGSHLVINGETRTVPALEESSAKPIPMSEPPVAPPITPGPVKKITTKIKTEDLVPRAQTAAKENTLAPQSLAAREKVIINGEIQDLPLILGQSTAPPVSPQSPLALSNDLNREY